MCEHPLKVARERKGLTMRSLALALPLGKGGHRKVWDWEHGRVIPSITSAHALAQKLEFESAREVRKLCQEWQEDRMNRQKEKHNV